MHTLVTLANHQLCTFSPSLRLFSIIIVEIFSPHSKEQKSTIDAFTGAVYNIWLLATLLKLYSYNI